MSNTNTVSTAGFALNLLNKEIAAKPGENVVLSPLSVSVALGMVVNGARNNTLQQMTSVLGLPNDATASNAAYGALLASLKRPGLGVTLKIANAIFARTGFEFVPEFLAANIRHFGAKLDTLDFSDDASVDEINDWVSKNTKKTPKDKEGMITKLLEAPIDPNTIMFLLNALVFKGEWNVKFDKSLTKTGDFTKGDGTKVQRDIMYRQGEMAYVTDWKDKVYSAIVLPFGDSKECRQVIVAPQDGRAVQDVLAVLTPEKLLELCANDYESEGELWLPRQKLTYENELNGSLIGLGMDDAFNPGAADLTGLYAGDGNAFISRVKHKVVFNLDEEGAEGAAVTSVEIGLESCRMPWQFNVNRDFLGFTVTKDGAIKFAKYVTDPKAE